MNTKIIHYNNFQLIVIIMISILLVSSCGRNKKNNVGSSESLADYIEQNNPLITAHRGFAEIAPENTISAFKAAFKAGANASEFDVHMALDGTLVVCHDETVDRTTNGTGKNQ